MDAPSLSLASSPLAAPGAAPVPLATPGGDGVRGADFANLLSQLLQPAELRQDLAAGGPPGLQAMSLSPNIEVITVDEPLPDNDSLLAFARSQGLDNATLQALFLPGQALVGTAPAAVSPLVPAPASASAAALDPVAEAATTLAGLAALGGQALKRLEVQLAPPPAAAPAAMVQAEPVPPPPLIQEAMRLRLQPQEAITRRLAELAVTGQQLAWGQVAASAGGDAGSDPLALDLHGLSPETLEALAAETDAPQATHQASAPTGEAGRRLASGAEAGPSAAAQAEERVAQYERLAQRLGEALGQRLQAQIERGQWKVQMQVDPASLGRIDMELDMRAGGLEAVFRSDNQLTRDLIAQGLPRLRESLAQSGTAVANVWVQGDSSRQSGGNPTPGRWASAGRGAAGVIEEDSPAQTLPNWPRAGSSAWDVLA